VTALRKETKGLIAACLLTLALSTDAFAQQQNAADQTQLIQSLIMRIDQLEKRVAELESATPQSPPVPVNSTQAAAEAMQMVTQSSGVESHPALNMAGFSDFTYGASNQKGTNSSFSEGQFILHFNSNLSAKVSFMGELSLTARTDAGTGTPPAPGFNPEIERSIIRYEHNDYFKISFGRYHTPINYWNTTFHHGQWLQTTVSRPEMVQFGGKFIPVHFVGALVEGAAAANGLNVNYNFGVGNGRGNAISRAGDASDDNNAKAWLVNAFVRPDRLYGLQIGGSSYRDKINTGGRTYNEWITAAHIVLTKESPEILAEFANARHERLDASASVANSQAFYVQAGYRLPILEKALKPYYRFEYIHVPLSDTLLQPISNLAGSVAGVRYDFTNFAAFKFEFRNQRRGPGQSHVNSGFIQTSFAF